MRAELFLREKNWWHDSATHMECIFEEILRSAEHTGVRQRDCQCRSWQKNDHLPPWAPTTSCATAFEQLSSRNDHQLVKSLVEVSKCQFTAGKLRSLSDEVEDKLKAHIWASRSAPTSNSSSGAVGPLVRSSARSLLRIVSATACNTSQGCSAREDEVPVEGIYCPNGGGLPVGPDTKARVRNTTLSRWHCSLDQRGASDVQREKPKSDHQKSGEEKWVWFQEPPLEELRESPCLKSHWVHFLGSGKCQGKEEWPYVEESKDQWEVQTLWHGMGAIPKQPHPIPPAYATDTHRPSSASASSTPPLAAQVDEPHLVKEHNKWVQLHASQMQSDLRWWPEVVYVPYQERTNPQHLARLIAASFELLWRGSSLACTIGNRGTRP